MVCVLQLLPQASDIAGVTRNGGRNYRSDVGNFGDSWTVEVLNCRQEFQPEQKRLKRPTHPAKNVAGDLPQ
jgi:hypothetical protein